MFTKKLITFSLAFFMSFGLTFAQEEASTTSAEIPAGIELTTSEGEALGISTDTTEEGGDFSEMSEEEKRAELDRVIEESGLEVGGVETVPGDAPMVDTPMAPAVEATTEPIMEGSMYRTIAKWTSVLSAILLVIFILMQERGSGLSSTFGGTGTFYASKRGVEKIIFRFTILLAIVFTVSTLLIPIV